MKTLIINGSPHKNGNTSFLADMLKGLLKGECDTIYTYDMDFKPCTDCGSCLCGNPCPLNDDAAAVIKKIDEYDCIAAASPLHYNQPTGSFLSFASRLQAEYAQNIVLKTKRPKPKKAGIIVCGGGDSVINSADAEKTMRIVLRQVNAEAFAYARSLNTSLMCAEKDKKAIAQIRTMAEMFNSD